MADKVEVTIESEVVKVIDTERALQADLSKLEGELAAVPQFAAFLDKQAELRRAQAQSTDIWKRIEGEMIKANIKSIKGDWGSITITERPNYKVVDVTVLPNKFIKRVPDTTKIGQSFELEGKLPAGVERTIIKYLMKRLK